MSTPWEADTQRLLAVALLAGREVFVPRCLSGREMGFFRIFRMEDLKPGRFGILEPDPARCPPMEVEEGFDGALCLAPGVAFDAGGFRLGYGKGYYDRFLAGKKIVCVGLCYRELVLERLPADEHDQRVGFLATEDGCMACRAPDPERKSL